MANLTLTNLIEEVWPRAEQLLEDYLKEQQEQNRYRWLYEVFNVEETDSWEQEWKNISSFRPWPSRSEGQPIPMTDVPLPDTMLAELGGFADSFMITREYVKYVDRRIRLWPDLRDYVRRFVKGALSRMSGYAASIMLDAFNGNFYKDELDGDKPLCATDHSGPGTVTFSNMLTGALSESALTEAYQLSEELVDEHGNPIDLEFDTLVVGRGLYTQAWKIINSINEPGGNNNDPNFWRNQLKVVTCPYLRENIQTGASQYWFLIARDQATLEGRVGMAPSVNYEKAENQVDYVVRGMMDVMFNWVSWQGVVGSNGTT